jgi:hypothetical protein
MVCIALKLVTIVVQWPSLMTFITFINGPNMNYVDNEPKRYTTSQAILTRYFGRPSNLHFSCSICELKQNWFIDMSNSIETCNWCSIFRRWMKSRNNAWLIDSFDESTALIKGIRNRRVSIYYINIIMVSQYLGISCFLAARTVLILLTVFSRRFHGNEHFLIITDCRTDSIDMSRQCWFAFYREE